MSSSSLSLTGDPIPLCDGWTMDSGHWSLGNVCILSTNSVLLRNVVVEMGGVLVVAVVLDVRRLLVRVCVCVCVCVEWTTAFKDKTRR